MDGTTPQSLPAHKAPKTKRNAETFSQRLSSPRFRHLPRFSLIRLYAKRARPNTKTPFFIFSSTLIISLLIFGLIALLLDVSKHQPPILFREALNETNETHTPQEETSRQRAIVMSCPVGHAQNHDGNWKPRNMVKGVEAVLKQLETFESNIPLLFGYYNIEKQMAEPWCRNLSETHMESIEITCFEIPEKFPRNMYGYAKVYAIRHAPADEVLWLDCDVFPVRSLDPLFEDEEFQKSGAMFWPDSRDHFNEKKLAAILNIERNKKVFPLNAWWVRQGFDSGMVLVNRRKCRQQIEAICRITRSPEMKILRDLSMGDKDIFHVVWMLHGKNFTLVPYLGESGNIQARMKFKRQGNRNVESAVLSSLRWQLSSQVKYGRDGMIYGLHQLHVQSGVGLIATQEKTQMFRRMESIGHCRHVEPYLIVQKDLRIAEEGEDGDGGGGADFVREIERALIEERGGKKRGPRIVEDETKVGGGVVICRGPEWVHRAAYEMGSTWRVPRRRGMRQHFHKETGNALLRAVGTGRYARHLHNKMQRRMQQGGGELD